MEKRWGFDFDRVSVVFVLVSRVFSVIRRGFGEDGVRFFMSFLLLGLFSFRRSIFRFDSLLKIFSFFLSRVLGFGRESFDFSLFLGRSCLDEWYDGVSVVLSEVYS